ncbi:hypothetical protein D9M68_791640 [compost metagenome]
MADWHEGKLALDEQVDERLAKRRGMACQKMVLCELIFPLFQVELHRLVASIS